MTPWTDAEGKSYVKGSGRQRRSSTKLPLWKRLRRAIRDINETGAVFIALDAHGVGREIYEDLLARDHPIAYRIRQTHAQWTLQTVRELRALGLGTASRTRAKGYPQAVQWLLEQHSPRDYHERRQPSAVETAGAQVLQELRAAIRGGNASTPAREALPEARTVDADTGKRAHAREGDAGSEDG